ncbi:MAG: stage II sporulation protein P, partial [Clostridia bacterium]|nr:stage II sporulation protein P [Clostridia bacterium]
FAIHDLNMYDEGDFSAAYSKSRAATEEWLKKYPSIRYVLDIHRDSVESGGLAAAAVAEVEGRRAAQIMIVVGTDEKAGRHTGWKTNLANAVKLWKALYAISPSLVRPIYLRSASFNQDISPGALIIEVGSQGNTLEEAQESARLLARAMAECFS